MNKNCELCINMNFGKNKLNYNFQQQKKLMANNTLRSANASVYSH